MSLEQYKNLEECFRLIARKKFRVVHIEQKYVAGNPGKPGTWVCVLACVKVWGNCISYSGSSKKLHIAILNAVLSGIKHRKKMLEIKREKGM